MFAYEFLLVIMGAASVRVLGCSVRPRAAAVRSWALVEFTVVAVVRVILQGRIHLMGLRGRDDSRKLVEDLLTVNPSF